MSESSITIRTYKCDGNRCTMEEDVKDKWHPPVGWMSLTIYDGSGANKSKHLCPECVKDLSEVYPIR